MVDKGMEDKIDKVVPKTSREKKQDADREKKQDADNAKKTER